MSILRSLTLPINNAPKTYKIPSYIFTKSISNYSGNTYFLQFDNELDSNFYGTIEIHYDTDSCVVLYDRASDTMSLLKGRISDATLAINSAGKMYCNKTGDLRVVVRGENFITEPVDKEGEDNSDYLTCDLDSITNPVSVYSGTGSPDSALGQSGDIYIKILSTSSSPEGNDTTE